jgi:starch synthase
VKVLQVASEFAPYSKTGGLGDVTAALSAELARQGAEVTVLVPRYAGSLPDGAVGARRFAVRGLDSPMEVIELTTPEGPRIWLLDQPRLYLRSGIYGEHGEGYADNPYRFGAMCHAAAQLALEFGFDIVQAHDWQAALTLEYLAELPQAVRPATVLTLHNLAFQGRCSPDWIAPLRLRPERFVLEGFEFWGDVNPLKGAIGLADAITTVSPGYAREILTPAFGEGLDGLLRGVSARLTGILNGIGGEWDPATDPLIAARYEAGATEGKALCRAELLREAGLDDPGLRPVVGMVCRLTRQKGIDLALRPLELLLERDAIRLIALGAGDADLEAGLAALAARFPARASYQTGYAEGLAHRIEAGADLFLMPSRYEPCGLNQLYSMRYGTLPIVRAVGGLADTVTDLSAPDGTGIVFEEASEAGVASALDRAIAAFAQQGSWQKAIDRAMRRPADWQAPAAAYLNLYSNLTTR